MTLVATITMNPAIDISTRTQKVVPTAKLRCETPTVQAGGGGINVARVVGRAGVDVVAIFTVGGSNGARLQDAVAAEGIATKAVPIAGQTRESLTVTEKESGEQYRFVMPGPSITEAEAEALFTMLREVEPAPRCIVLSGSLPPGIEPRSCTNVGALAAELGAALIVDGPGDMLSACLGAYLIKPNLVELESYTGEALPDAVTQAKAARAMIDKGISKNVLVSLGEDGALLVTPERALRYSAPKVDLVSAVGAGDSMVAGVIIGLSRGESLEDAVARGSAAGAAAILTPHTELARIEDMERLLPEVTREEIATA
ncbi:1-phosphofructokinase family hexose kinase [Acuticoccus sp. M5D2P5]|uniref:1-phosphofructokinase family hexose kinase n=1 Tax=Acuticoccus kalidii TaxID=2910977 RepID=UPI001F2D74D8|nr:1-phosphofructokinase family hexose kinase [Acuticoccus kalidii]